MSDFSAIHDEPMTMRECKPDLDAPLNWKALLGAGPETTSGLLDTREKTHGNYPEQTVTAQGLKYLAHSAPNWERMTPAMKESVEMICTKLARILHGDCLEIDHWRDGAGYFQLVEKTL